MLMTLLMDSWGTGRAAAPFFPPVAVVGYKIFQPPPHFCYYCRSRLKRSGFFFPKFNLKFDKLFQKKHCNHQNWRIQHLRAETVATSPINYYFRKSAEKELLNRIYLINIQEKQMYPVTTVEINFMLTIYNLKRSLYGVRYDCMWWGRGNETQPWRQASAHRFIRGAELMCSADLADPLIYIASQRHGS